MSQRLYNRIAELEAVLGVRHDDVAIYRAAFALNRDQAEILGLLLKRSGVVSRASIYTVIYGGRPDCDQPDDRLIDVMLCKLRKPLRAIGAEIKTSRGVGWLMLAPDKAKVRAYLADSPEVAI